MRRDEIVCVAGVPEGLAATQAVPWLLPAAAVLLTADVLAEGVMHVVARNRARGRHPGQHQPLVAGLDAQGGDGGGGPAPRPARRRTGRESRPAAPRS